MKCLVVSVLVIVAVVVTVNCRGDDVTGEHEGSSSSNGETRLVEETPDTELDVVPDQPQGRRSLTDNAQQLVITDIAQVQHKEREEDHEIDSRKDENNSSFWRKIDKFEQKIVATCKAKYDIEMAIDTSELELKIMIDSQNANLDTILANFTDQVGINISNTMDNSIAKMKDDIDMKIDTLELQLKNKIEKQTGDLDEIIVKQTSDLDEIIVKQTSDLDEIIVKQTSDLDEIIVNLKGDIEIKLHTMMKNLTTTLEYMVTKLQGLQLRCSSANGILSPVEDQCFIFVADRKNFETAEAHCNTNGLQFAKPENHNVKWLRKYVLDTYGDAPTWVGGRGDGTNFRWVRDQTILYATSSLWTPGHPSSNVGRGFGTDLLTHTGYVNNHPNKPYYSWAIGSSGRFICELM